MSERAVPFYCPYCGDEDLRPAEATHGSWYCASCLRTFALKMIGIGVPGGVVLRARAEGAEQHRSELVSVATETDLRAVAEQGATRLGPDATAQQVLAWAAETFDKLIVASNMQDAVLVDLAAKAAPGVEVLFLETGYHFAETIGTRDAVEHVYDVTIVNAQAQQSVAEQDATSGKDLFARDPNRCCALRKVAPLQDTLAGYDAWVTGVRRVEAPTRANTPLVTYDEKFGLVKLNPIAAWSDEEMEAYIAEHGILVNPLVAEGYPSIGCAPCTARPAPGADPRSGRWAGTGKIECGLHVQ